MQAAFPPPCPSPVPAGPVRRIRHLALTNLPDGLAVEAGDGGCFVVLWQGDRAVGQIDLPRERLPLDGPALAAAAAAAVGPLPTEPAAPVDAGRLRADLSVIICTRDRPEALARCLDSLAALPHPPVETVVVDNGPADPRSRAVVASSPLPGLFYIAEPRPGLDVARNTGVRAAARPLVAFVDDDVRLHPGWLDAMAAAFADPGVDAVTGLVLPEVLDTPAQYHFERYWSFAKGFRPLRFDPAWLARHAAWGAPVWEIGAGASMGFRRDMLLRIGLFDERLDAGAAGCSGDSEAWYRVLAAGGTCLYDPSIIAFHTHRADEAGLRRQLRAYMRGHVAALLVQHERTGHRGNLRRALVGIPRYYARHLLAGLRHGWAGRRSTLADEIAGALDGFRFYLTAPRPTAPGERRPA